MSGPASALVAEARQFAFRAHEGQQRKGTNMPYIVHPSGVAEVLTQYYPANEPLIAAGWLHDVLEDTSTSRAELELRFGPRVAEIVAAVTKRRDGAPWQLDAGADPDVVRLKAADVLDNMRATLHDAARMGEAGWHRFKGGRAAKLAYYRGLIDQIAAARAINSAFMVRLETAFDGLTRAA